MEELLFILLLKKDMNKLFKFYWKKGKQMLFVDCFFFFFFFFFSFFLILKLKGERTPLSVAAENGYEQIVQILLEKGANVDLADQVILLIVSFFFHFLIFLFFECKGWSNSSFYGCL